MIKAQRRNDVSRRRIYIMNALCFILGTFSKVYDEKTYAAARQYFVRNAH